MFPLGAGPTDALLKLGHLGILSLKVFCGKINRQTGSQGSPKAGRQGCGRGWKPTLLTGGAADEHLHPQTLPVQVVSGRGWGGDFFHSLGALAALT